MAAGWVWVVAAALVIGAISAPPPASAQDSAEVARARQVLEYYQACERSRRFGPCWTLLSKRAQAGWTAQGRGTVTEYAEARGAGEPHFTDFRVFQIRRSPARVVFVVEAATAISDKGVRRERVEYALLREGGQWKVDGLRVGQSETTP